MPHPSAAALLAWYDRHRRRLPWRAAPGEPPDPYRVWLSEIMLQQTTVAAILPRFARFLERFPTVDALAQAPADAVMAEWAGLGYYARARNLHACARAVAAAGGFPGTVEGLRALPGVGAYTAAAVAAIAFGVPAVPVDGNVERVAARVFVVEDSLPGARPEIGRLAARLGEQPQARSRPGDFAQALFDLGATICTPRAPACALCPWRDSCEARRRGLAAVLPRKAPKPNRPVRHGAHFWLQDEAGMVLLQRRPPRGLLGGTLALPGTAWRGEPWSMAEALGAAPAEAPWQLAGVAEHGFTHFTLRADVYRARMMVLPPGGEHRRAAAAMEEMPTVFARMARLAAGSSGQQDEQSGAAWDRERENDVLGTDA